MRAIFVEMARRLRIWTWDCGQRLIDLDDDEQVARALETVLEGGLWKQFRRFPRRTVARVLPRLRVPDHTRRLLELWIEETPGRAA